MTALKWSAFLLLAAVVPAVAGEQGRRGFGESQEDIRQAAEQGDAEAQYRLGYAYYDPRAVERDYRKAVRWFAEAAKQGHAPAMVMLGKCHASGGNGLVQDMPRALAWFERAAKLHDAGALSELGAVCRWGRGVEQDWPKAFGYYYRAAKLGHGGAEYVVGQFLEHGIGTGRDARRAVEWYTRAANRGDPRAQEKLGRCYENGVGVAKDIDKALEWYARAAEQGTGKDELARLRAIREGETPPSTSRAETYPATDDVEVTLAPEKTDYEMGEPIVISIVHRNVGRKSYLVREDHFGTFHSTFAVKDENGRVLPNPYGDMAPVCLNGPVSTHVLKPGGEVAIRRTLNECVVFGKPGTYSVTACALVSLGTDPWSEADRRRAKVTPLGLTIRDYDRTKRARDTRALLSAYKSDGPLRKGLPFEKHIFNGERLGIVRLLAFLGDPELIPFFLDVLEDQDRNGYAGNGLAAMSDRSAVLKAFEERLGHPEKHDVTKLLWPYLRLAAPRKDWKQGLAVWKAREELRRKYRAKAMRLLKQDSEYRYAYLVPGLLGGSDDLLLVDYLLRSGPDRGLLRQCALTIGTVNLGREHVPSLEGMLDIERDWSITDAAITQLVRLDREKYLPLLRRDAQATKHRFSPEIRSLLDEELGRD